MHGIIDKLPAVLGAIFQGFQGPIMEILKKYQSDKAGLVDTISGLVDKETERGTTEDRERQLAGWVRDVENDWQKLKTNVNQSV